MPHRADSPPAIAPDRYPAPPMDQFNYALSEVSDQLIHYVISFDGTIDEGRLRAAFLRTMDIVPVLGCRFVEADTPYWERLARIGSETVFRIHPSGDPDRDLKRILPQPVDVAAAPPVRLDILRSFRDTLCITVHHAAMDARGLVTYAALLAALYRQGEPGSGGHRPALFDRTLAPVLSQFSPEEQAALRSGSGGQHAVWGFPSRSNNCSRRSFAIRTLPPERLEAIQRYGKLHGATVNDILLCAFFLSLCTFAKPAAESLLPVLVSIDLRRYISGDTRGAAHPAQHTGAEPAVSFTSNGTAGPGAFQTIPAICNLSVAFEVLLESGTRTLDDAIPGVIAAMQQHKTHAPGIVSALDIESLGTGGYAGVRRQVCSMEEVYRKTGNKTPLFVNIGIIKEDQLLFSNDLPVRNAFFAVIIVYPPGIAFCASTYCGMLTLSVGYCSSAVRKETVEQFRDNVAGHLPGA